MKVVSFIVLVSLTALATPALADVRPPPLRVVEDKTPPAARMWMWASVNAMKKADVELAGKLCDPRGYTTNLVGGSGNPLESLFAQGAKKGWHLVANFDQTKKLADDKGVILRTTVRNNDDNKILDEVYVLLIKTTDVDGATRWVALGAGEKLAQVEALAARFVEGKPLAPPAE